MIVAAAVSGDRDVLEPARAVMRAQATAECGTVQFLAGEECAIGWAPTADRYAPFALARRGAQGNLLVVTGTPIALTGGLDARLARALELRSEAAAALLSELEGAYAILHWDSEQRALTIVTDPLGLQPLHLARTGAAFYCSTALRGLTGGGVIAARPDAAAWGSFFVFGHPLGERTLVEGVERAPAASVLTVRMPGPVELRRTYWTWPHPEKPARDPGTAPLMDAIQRSVEGYREYGHAGAVLMSGGFDSRLVLLTLLRNGMQAKALLVRHRDEAGDADVRLGRRAAQLAGADAEVITPPADFYSSPAYRKYLERSELSTPPLEVFIARVISAMKPGLACVWDGLCIQALRALPGAPTSFSAYLEQPALRARSLLVSPAPFRDDWAHAMYEGFARLLKEETAKYRDDEHGVAQFSLRNRTRLRIACNPYRVFGVDALAFTPGLTREYYSIVAGLSNQLKGAHRLIHRVYREHFPQALRVPFISGGRLLNLSGRPSWDYACTWLMQTVTDNYYALELMRRTGVVRRPAHSSIDQLRALLPALPAGDDCLDERTLALQPPPAALRRLYYWQLGRSLFRPPVTQPSLREAAQAA